MTLSNALFCISNDFCPRTTVADAQLPSVIQVWARGIQTALESTNLSTANNKVAMPMTPTN
jgi:hypothetical protein